MKKNLILSAAVALMVSSCGPSIKQIGYLNMISTRNVSVKEQYVSLRNGVGGDNRDLKRNKAATVDMAVGNLVKNVPGGEFVQNAKIYVIGKEYAVSGDVWGLSGEINHKGFKIGDHVMWKDNFVKFTGVITELKDDKECTVKQDENGKIRIVRYDEMSKI